MEEANCHPPFPPELILTQLSALALKRAGSLLFQILLLWFDIFSSSVGQGHYFTSTHYFCICSALLKSTRLWRMICSMKCPFLMNFCILCGHFSSSHSNGLLTRKTALLWLLSFANSFVNSEPRWKTHCRGLGNATCATCSIYLCVV